MKQNKRTLLLILVFVVLLGGAYLLYDRLAASHMPNFLLSRPSSSDTSDTTDATDSTPSPSEDERTAAPDFTAYDANGNAVRLADFIGRPTVLNFWASWCGPCQSEMPGFQSKFEEHGEDVAFLMVNMTMDSRESFEKATAFIAEQGYTFPVFYDNDNDAAITYGVTSLPTTYFIDAEGYLVAWAAGAIDEATLAQGIGMILPE